MIESIKPKLIGPICCSFVCMAPNIAILLYFIENAWNTKMIITTVTNIFCLVLTVVSRVNYSRAMDNYKDMIKKYYLQLQETSEEIFESGN